MGQFVAHADGQTDGVDYIDACGTPGHGDHDRGVKAILPGLQVIRLTDAQGKRMGEQTQGAGGQAGGQRVAVF